MKRIRKYLTAKRKTLFSRVFILASAGLAAGVGACAIKTGTEAGFARNVLLTLWVFGGTAFCVWLTTYEESNGA